MRRSTACLRGLVLLLCMGILPPSWAGSSCEAEANWVQAGAARHFMVLVARSGVFHDASGPAFVMLIRTTAEESAIGAVGVYADAGKQPAFGAVPASVYEHFLREPGNGSDVMLRLEISGPQYERALEVLKTWDRRVRERMLLYPDIAMDNILLIKQATQELNRCRQAVALYELDWGLEDEISEHNLASRIPFEYFKELKKLNEGRHVSDAAMPSALLSALEVPQAGER